MDKMTHDYSVEIMAAVGATSMEDAAARVQALASIRPVVWVKADTGQIVIAPDLTVSGAFQLIRVLEGLKVAA